MLGTRRSIPVELEIKKGNTLVNNVDNSTLSFDSLTSCIEYLRGLGLIIKRDTLTKYIINGKVFHNFLCKYSINTLPEGFENIGLIMDEYKKVDTYSSGGGTSFKEETGAPLPLGCGCSALKKNKAITVKGENPL